MLSYTQIKFLRRPEVLDRFGFSNTLLHTKTKAGLIPPPCQLGGRAVAWFEHEINTVIAAMVAGETDQELRDLVQGLIKNRKRIAGELAASYAS